LKFHRAGVGKMRARMKHMAKEKAGTSSTNTVHWSVRTKGVTEKMV